ARSPRLTKLTIVPPHDSSMSSGWASKKRASMVMRCALFVGAVVRCSLFVVRGSSFSAQHEERTTKNEQRRAARRTNNEERTTSYLHDLAYLAVRLDLLDQSLHEMVAEFPPIGKPAGYAVLHVA